MTGRLGFLLPGVAFVVTVAGIGWYGNPAYLPALYMWAAGAAAAVVLAFAFGMRAGRDRAWDDVALADRMARRTVARGLAAARRLTDQEKT